MAGADLRGAFRWGIEFGRASTTVYGDISLTWTGLGNGERFNPQVFLGVYAAGKHLVTSFDFRLPSTISMSGSAAIRPDQLS